MPAASRLTDLWAGICCCHSSPTCIPMSGPVITASPDDISGNLNQARLTDMTIGWCGHTGIIVTSAPYCDANNLGKARIGDSVVGCNIGVLVTGNATHLVENGGGMGSSCGSSAPSAPETTVDYEGSPVTYTEVDFGNLDDEPGADDGLNIWPPVVGREPTTEEVARSEALDNFPTDTTGDSTGAVVIDATAVTCIEIPPDLPDSFQLSIYFKLGSLSTQTALSRVKVKAQHGYTANEIVCNLQGWAENIGDPLIVKYGNNLITSGFRIGSGTSQHERGMAADIQWPGKSNTYIYNIAIWIKDNLPYDQLILEYGGHHPWIHISFNRFGNRPPTAGNRYGTRISGNTYKWGHILNMS